MSAYENRYWQSDDGIRLHCRDYAGRADRPPILCLPGLTRNARDFANVAARLAGEWRVICVDFRGRGESGYAKDPMTYVPPAYVRDIEGLLADLGCERFVAFGTSMGGLVTMLLAAAAPSRIAGALLNDVGPEIEAAGLSRIRGYVGRAHSWPTWLHAARGLQEANADVYPHYETEDWLGMAKRLYRITAAGRIVLDYDMNIAEPFRVADDAPAPDLWPLFEALRPAPVLIVRGGRSDVLSGATAEGMRTTLDHAELVTIADVGHTPTLTEPAAAAAIDRLLDRVAREPARA